MVFSIVLLMLLAVILLYQMAGWVGGLAHAGMGSRYSRTVGPKIDEVVLEESSASDKIAVLPVNGIISGQGLDQGGASVVEVLKAGLRRAAEDDEVKAVILKVDSPGGEVLASDEMYRAIVDFQKKHGGKPVIASMGNLAASGGYYISSPCRWIVANEMTITGSIGVIMHGYNYRGLMDKVGLRQEVYKSGKFKDMLSPDRAPDQIPAEEREMVQKLVDETYSRFRNVVAEGRGWSRQANKGGGHALSEDWVEYADGRVLSGREALEHGFVDQLGNFDDSVARARTIAGLSKATVVQYQQRYDLSDLLRLFGKSEARAIKVDLGVDFPKLQAGQLYFLSPVFVH